MTDLEQLKSLLTKAGTQFTENKARRYDCSNDSFIVDIRFEGVDDTITFFTFDADTGEIEEAGCYSWDSY